jgi:type II secretory ATPase GspE/PulE/Tfp pilus assembly ATPase PilB-like protein
LTFDHPDLKVAINDPLNLSRLQELEYKTGLRVNPVMVSREDLQRCLKHISGREKIVEDARPETEEIALSGESATVLVEKLIQRAIHEKTSDIHLEPRQDGFRIRFRIDGILYEKEKFNKKLERNILSRIKILCGMDVAESRRPQDGRMTVHSDLGEYELRASTLPNINGENMVLRVLSKNFSGQDFQALGMELGDQRVVMEMIQKPHGLILVTGPTGSGKTTSLYSVLSQLNENSKNIISVEDPVEYELPGINQTMVNRQLGYTFANAMKNILRHDPDIIMVGEIRDKETAEMAIQAALTGHLVLSTIHTNTAAGAITRLVEMDIEPFLIGSALNGVIAQRLIRHLCPTCKRKVSPDKEMMSVVERVIPDAEVKELSVPVGCPDCLLTGYQGRTAIFEVFKVDQAIRELILRKAHEPDLVACAHQSGLRDLRQAALKKALTHETSIDEVMRITMVHE